MKDCTRPAAKIIDISPVLNYNHISAYMCDINEIAHVSGSRCAGAICKQIGGIGQKSFIFNNSDGEADVREYS